MEREPGHFSRSRWLSLVPVFLVLGENFSDSSFHHIFESENFNFPFFYEKKPNRGSEMLKIKLQKILGNLLNELRNLYMNGKVI